MKSCAYCGRENPDGAWQCHECGTANFADHASLARSAKPGEKQAAERLEPERAAPTCGESALCTACLFPNPPDSRWCQRCDAPMDSCTLLLLPDAARAAGFVYRRAVETRPKPVVVGVIWLHFLPGFLSNALALLMILEDGLAGAAEFAGAFLLTLGGLVCASMLYRVTRNAFSPPKVECPETGG